MKKQKENSHEGITWSEMGKQNVQAEKVYYLDLRITNEKEKEEVEALELYKFTQDKNQPRK